MKSSEDHRIVLGQQRETWSRQLEFVLSSIGYAVGLGNVWRFPYLCYKNGGGAFFIPYFAAMCLCGLPTLLMEVTIGQITQCGPIHAFMKICPLLKGVGLATVVVCFILCSYFNTLMSWVLLYLFNSFSSPLPWQSCNNTWNVLETCSAEFTMNDMIQQSASQQFFNYKVLGISEGLENMGSIRWELLGCLSLAWIIIYLCLFKGVQHTSKVVYFTALFPYCILFIMLVFTSRLPGSADGILFFLTPKWHKLKEVQVWIDALSQNFFSLGVGTGVMVSMASYNDFNYNILRNSVIVTMANSASSIFSGFVVFSALGYMSHIRNVSVEDLGVGGPGLAFVVYPEILATMPVPQVWAFLFFLMLLCLQLDCVFASLEVVVSTVMDCVSPRLYPCLRRKELMVLLVCFLSFLLGLPCVFQGGVYVFQLMDHYTVAVSVLVMALLEIAAISWILGLKRFSLLLTRLLRKRPNMYFKICWLIFTPLLVLVVLVASMVQHTPPRYGKSYEFPDWSKAVGWMLTMASIICIPLGAAHELYSRKGSFMERLRSSVVPSAELEAPLGSHKEQEMLLPTSPKDEDAIPSKVLTREDRGLIRRKSSLYTIPSTSHGLSRLK